MALEEAEGGGGVQEEVSLLGKYHLTGRQSGILSGCRSEEEEQSLSHCLCRLLVLCYCCSLYLSEYDFQQQEESREWSFLLQLLTAPL